MEFSEKYRLEKRLGTQSKRKFGEIFLAIDNRSQEKVALKAVKTNLEDLTNAERLKAEASFTFDFDGLPKTLEFEETESNLFLVRKYVEGIPLDQYWGTLKRRHRSSFVIQLLENLLPIFEHLKQHEVVHCDIKPSNILIAKTGDSFKVHLLDFGLSIRTSENDENRKRKLLFPLGYAAPELLLNHLELVDQRADIFALGVLIWRLYAGNLPLVHPNPSVFTNLQLTHPLPEHSEISKKMYIILKGMAHKHQFKLPPNQMDRQEVQELLASAINERYDSLDEVIQAFKGIDKKRFWK
ncbi:MAG: serine/threonine-protein kinase [Crocinitomicaceae bacterium]|nr:serine/threonine-protein kinase [Crocinitomicaceae bacterium]